MNWTLGSMMFYGGITGVIATMILSVIAVVIFKKSKKKIIKQLDDEYGGRH